MEHPSMTIERGSKRPLIILPVNDTYLLGVYQGSISEYDILLKYRQKDRQGNWSRIRTPKHIHWTVDMLIKLHENEEETKRFLDFLIGYWVRTQPIKTEEERNIMLNVDALLNEANGEAAKYTALFAKGEYSVKFLILLAKLLMVQEKTNRADAYMFGEVLEKLREGKDIFSVISAATHNGR